MKEGSWLSKQIEITRSTFQSCPSWIQRIAKFEGSDAHSVAKREVAAPSTSNAPVAYTTTSGMEAK